MPTRILIPLALAAAFATTGMALAQTPPLPALDEVNGHLLNCTILDWVKMTEDGRLMPDQPEHPGARVVGRVNGLLIDVSAGTVRLVPGGNAVGWVFTKGENDPLATEWVLTPVNAPAVATTQSVHVWRRPNLIWFEYFATNEIMSGTCTLIPP